MCKSKVRVLIADDQPLFRDGLRGLLEADREFLVLDVATNGVDALRLTRQLEPDILVLEWNLPEMTGAVVLRELAAGACTTPVIVLTAAIDKGNVQKALELGAQGLVPKTSEPALLLRAIRAVMAGQYWFDRESLGDLVDAFRALSASASLLGPQRKFGLTCRELEIVSAVAAAYSNKNIALRFSISEKTVKHHLSNIFDKLGVCNRLELAVFAVNHGMEVADKQVASESPRSYSLHRSTAKPAKTKPVCR
jgi:DNA-binding NarL/FixJ family response regulator